jgi:hypothetical protein
MLDEKALMHSFDGNLPGPRIVCSLFVIISKVGFPTVRIFSWPFLILSCLYETLIQDGEKSENSAAYRIFNISHYHFMENGTFKHSAIVVGTLLLFKIQLVPLVLVRSFLKIDAS